MLKPQTCKRCNRIQYVVWAVSDNTWEEFCKRTGWNPNKTLCIECFAELAGYIDITNHNIDHNIYYENLYDEEFIRNLQ